MDYVSAFVTRSAAGEADNHTRWLKYQVHETEFDFLNAAEKIDKIILMEEKGKKTPALNLHSINQKKIINY